MPKLIILLALLLAGCSGIVRDRIYRPDPAPAVAPAWAGTAPQAVSARTADGLEIGGYYWPPDGAPRDILMFFHGNAGNRERAAQIAAPLRRPGSGLLVASYRGFGGNPGSPDEAGLMADGVAFLALARRLQPGSKVHLFGWSLGGAVALQLAAREDVDGVVTLGAFTRLRDVAPSIARGMLPDRFDNLAAIAGVREPVFLFHGTDDQVVPYSSAAQLEAASGGHATMVTLTGAGHHIDFRSIADVVWRALDGRGPPEAGPPRSSPPESSTQPATLSGTWRVAAIDGRPVDEAHRLLLTGDGDKLWWEPRCAGMARGYRIGGSSIMFASLAPPLPPGSPTPPVCAIGLPTRLNEVFRALDAATTIARAPENGILVAGGGRSLILSPH